MGARTTPGAAPDGATLLGALRRCLPDDRLPPRADEAELAALLDELCLRTRDRFPAITLDVEQLGPYLAGRLPPDQPLASGLARLAAEELVLCCACVGGCPRAIQQLEQTYFPAVRRAMLRFKLQEATVEELLQGLREQLFLQRSPGRPPLLVDYSGRGKLLNWIRVIAVRRVGEHLDRTNRELVVEDPILERMMTQPVNDQELQQLKRDYRSRFREAFGEGLSRLEPRQRNLLRQRYLDGLGIDRLSAFYGVHRATTARWLAAAREALLEHTRAALMQRLRVGQSEFQSIMRLIESQLEVTLGGLKRAD